MSAGQASAGATLRRDVVIVGGGLAGSAVATVLARRGMAVTLVDRYAEFPPMFRAEKIEPDQADLLRKLGLFDGVQPRTRMIREIIHGQRGKVVHRRRIEQFGISYCDIVNGVREQVPEGVDLRIGVVASIEPDASQPRVTMVDGTVIEARLVVLAAGMNGPLPEALGARKNVLMSELSMCFGFMLERTDGRPFDFDAVTYRPLSTSDKVGYLTLFRMGQNMRGNLFAYWPLRDASTKAMLNDGPAFLARVLPGLGEVIGPFGVAGRVEAFRIDLYRMESLAIPGVVVLGDAYQSVCPSTGTGLSKVLNDVDLLCNEALPQWWGQDAIGADRTAGFYGLPRKTAVDNHSLRLALAGRESVLDGSLAWRLRRRIRGLRFVTGW